jgi:type IV pilus assembly protein PilM
LIHELAAECQRQRIAAKEDCRRAARLFEACDYGGAAAVLQAVPPPARTEAILELIARTAARQENIASLTGELREAVREKRLADLPPLIQRLLALKPDHAYGKRLGGQVQEHLVQAARKQLAEHHYDEAFRLLQQTTPETRDPHAQELYQRAAELAWLTWDLRNAPVIDRTLTVVAQRLEKLASGNAPVVKACRELQHRARRAGCQPRREPLPWVRPPQPTALGVPVDFPAGFRRLTCDETMDQAELRKCPGRFAVACGLALSGIRESAIGINLLSSQDRGLLRRVTQLIQPRTMRSAWGIDIGASGLKAVKLVWDDANEEAVVEAASLIEYAKLLSYAVNEAEKRKLVSQALEAFLESHEPKIERVCVGLPGEMALVRQVDVPPIDTVKTAKVIQFDARDQFPLPLEELAWDYHVFAASPPEPDGIAQPADEQGRQALLIAAKRTATHHFLETFRELDVPVDVLQTDFLALHNFLAFEYFAGPENAKKGEACPVMAALDIGAEATNIVVSSPHSLWFHGCKVAGYSFTRALVKEFHLTLAQAEQQKRDPESTDRISRVYEALSPVLDDLSKEVQQSLSAYSQAHPDNPLQRVLGFGGGAMLHGLFRCLRCGR